MARIVDQRITETYAAYCGDCLEVLPGLPTGSVHLSVYSPPFGGLYNYSSDPRDLSNCASYEEFLEHYGLVVAELARVTMPGRISAVHCADISLSNSGRGDNMLDLPGDIIRLHERHGWRFAGRHFIWKEPLAVRMRTLAKGLAHQTIVEDATRSTIATADQVVIFRRAGENRVPVTHPTGLLAYAGSRLPPADVLRFRDWKGKQTENSYSHWIWRQYPSSFWDDIRLDRVLPFHDSKDEDDERHVHPLQLDVIERIVTLYSNPGERVLTPFMGVGSEVYGAVRLARFGLGSELKQSYYRQALQNLARATEEAEQDALPLLAGVLSGDEQSSMEDHELVTAPH